MNIKPETAVLAILTLSTIDLATAKAPDVDPAHIDNMVTEILRQADQHPNQIARPDGQAVRRDVVTRLQTLEILEDETFEASLGKDAEAQNQLKNIGVEFHTNQYIVYLECQTIIGDAELHRFYGQQTRTIKLQQVSLALAGEVRITQELLLRDLSFGELTRRYPNPGQKFDGLISLQQLPPQLTAALVNTTRDDVVHESIQAENRFHLLKLSAVGHDSNAEPLELVHNRIVQAVKQQEINN